MPCLHSRYSSWDPCHSSSVRRPPTCRYNTNIPPPLQPDQGPRRRGVNKVRARSWLICHLVVPLVPSSLTAGWWVPDGATTALALQPYQGDYGVGGKSKVRVIGWYLSYKGPAREFDGWCLIYVPSRNKGITWYKTAATDRRTYNTPSSHIIVTLILQLCTKHGLVDDDNGVTVLLTQQLDGFSETIAIAQIRPGSSSH